MDIKTGLSIYNKQWLIESQSALQLLDFFEKVKAGEKWDYAKSKGEDVSSYQIHKKFFAKNGVIAAPSSSYDMADFEGFEGATVAVIPIDGPVMKNDFCGSLGTNSLNQLAKMAFNSSTVKTVVFAIDTPGGTTDGTDTFASTIRNGSLRNGGKRTVALVSGMMCSAGYWFGSACDEIYASSKTDLIGCIGTMISFYDNSKALSEKGIVLREYYATDSKDKNAAFTEAIKGDGKKLVAELLDPMNNIFLSAVTKNRGNKINPDALTGKTYIAENALAEGLIDGIKSFDEIISYQPTTTVSNNSIITTKKSKMTAAEFKAENPAEYEKIVAEGVSAEKDRTKAWMAFKEIAPEAVEKGIESGASVTVGVIAEMSQLAMAGAKLKAVQADSAPTVEPVATTNTVESEKDMQLKAWYEQGKALAKAISLS